MAKKKEWKHTDYMIRPGGQFFEHKGVIINLEKVSAARLKKLAEDPTCHQVQLKQPLEERKAAVEKAKTIVELKRLLLTESAKTVIDAGEKRRAELEKATE